MLISGGPINQKDCLTDHIGDSVIFGSIFSAVHVAQGARLSPRLVGGNILGIYLYGALICPMEAVHGRQSSLHNFAAAGTLGYIGVATGQAGIPFVDPYCKEHVLML